MQGVHAFLGDVDYLVGRGRGVKELGDIISLHVEGFQINYHCNSLYLSALIVYGVVTSEIKTYFANIHTKTDTHTKKKNIFFPPNG